MSTTVAQRAWAVPDGAAAGAGVLLEYFAVDDGPVVGLVFRRYTDLADEAPADETGHQGPLTRQQMAVLRLIADGASNAEAGRALHISQETAKSHMARACRVIGARDRANAVAIGMREGWLV